MSIKITGLDEAIKSIDNLVTDLTTGLVDLGKELVSLAKEMCNDPNCERIITKKIEYDDTTKMFQMDLEFKDKSAIDCMINAIKTKLDSMNEGVKGIFETEIKELEKKKETFTN